MVKATYRDFDCSDLEALGMSKNPLVSVADILKSQGVAYTAVVDNEIVLSGGLFVLWPGVAEAWAVLGNFATQHPMWSHRIVKRKLKALLADIYFHRVQMHVTASDEKANRWAEALGFYFEGCLRKYSPEGIDMNIYSLQTESLQR